VDCRIGCAACCIAPSISSPLPGHPQGKPAGVRCANLTPDGLCRLWGGPDYPDVCRGFRPMPDVCGTTSAEALALIGALERATAPNDGRR
jgi:hypothetical protein